MVAGDSTNGSVKLTASINADTTFNDQDSETYSWENTSAEVEDTDWSQVNLEALRQHLLDMKAFTEEVEVLSQNPIESGIEIQVKPQTEIAGIALSNVFKMHPSMIKSEQGWEMKASQSDNSIWTITCTTDKTSEVDKIRGLGYIGLLATGAHHQLHHWMIATNHMGMEH